MASDRLRSASGDFVQSAAGTTFVMRRREVERDQALAVRD